VDSEIAQLTGGPQDGKTMMIPKPWLHINVAIPPDWITDWIIEGGDLRKDPQPFKTGIYDLEIGPLGKPSRNDRGELIYLWQGER
jgi:hypothetical protein